MVLKKVSKIYKIKDKNIHALDKINFEIDEAKNGFYVIKGHSGSGKTTLIQVLGLLNDIDSGVYEIDGKKIGDLTEKEKADLRLKKFGFIFQDYHLMSHLKAYENIIVPMLINNDIKKEDRKEKSLELLKKVNLENRTEHYPKELSGGEQQRVAIARALANNPSVILADEPTGNLDEENEKMVLKYLKNISKEKCIIVVSHSNLIDKYADKIYHMKEGKFVDEN